MRQLFIYHQESSTLISLDDEMYLIASDIVGDEMINEMLVGCIVYPMEHKGYRLDNYTMNNLLFRVGEGND